MKCYLINLDSSKERLAHMSATLAGLGIEFERFPAVYGKALTPEERSRDYDARRAFWASRGRPLLDGEIGCALSHVGVYRRMVENGVPIALVLEDDVGFEKRFLEALEFALRHMDVARAQITQFSAYRVECSAHESFSLKKMKSMSATDAYLITLPAAKAIIKANYPVITVADGYRRWRKRFGVELFRCLPPTARQLHEQFGTEVFELTRPKEARGLRRQLYWLIDWLYYVFTGK